MTGDLTVQGGFTSQGIDDNGNATAITIDSSGNVGIGVVPSSDSRTSFSQKTFQLGNSGSLINLDVSTSDRRTILTQNAILNTSGDFQRLGTGHVTAYQQGGGTHKWFSAGSDSVGTTAGVSEHMRLESGGNLLLRSTDSANITGHSSPYLEFRAGQTNGQNVTLGKIKGSSPGGWGGDIIFETKAANGQVNDTTAERLRIRENGGITFNGDTANANTLNDYEEGSYNTTFATDTSATVPNFAGTTYYIKIGKMVHIHGQIAVSGSSSGGINLHVPLPFTPVGMRGALTVGLNQALSMKPNGEYLTIIVETNSPKAYIVSTAFGGGHSHLGFDQCGSGLFTFAGSYRTT
jgi:hypothetical protein